MTKARDLADFVSAGNPLADGTIDVADINGITATTAELNYTDGVTSNIQTQLDAKVDIAGDTMTGDLSFGDNNKAIFGAGSDLQIYHDGANSFISDQGAGFLIFQGANRYQFFNDNSTAMYAQFVGDTAGQEYVQLRYNNATKLTTTSTGIDVTGTITADGLDMEDNQKILLGTGDDLQIYHDGSNSYINDVGSGDLYIRGSNNVQIEGANGENLAVFNENGAVNLYHNSALKFSTASHGVSVTGSAVASTQTWTTTSTSVLADFNIYQNFVWTLDRNITLANPSTEKLGQSGFFVFIHSGAGRTVSLGTDYETAGGAGLTLSGTSGATDIVPYIVAASGRILLGTPQLAFS